MFLKEIRNIFCVSDTNQFVSATNVARAGKRGYIGVRNNVSSFATAFIKRIKDSAAKMEFALLRLL